jgi:hypothetical protein
LFLDASEDGESVFCLLDDAVIELDFELLNDLILFLKLGLEDDYFFPHFSIVHQDTSDMLRQISHFGYFLHLLLEGQLIHVSV